MSVLTKKDVVIEWTVLEHKMIKFKDGTDTVYEVSDAVKTFLSSQEKFLDGAELKEGTKANVEIDPEQADNGLVEKITLAEGTTENKTEPTPETTPEVTNEVTPEVNGDAHVYSVKGVSVAKKCLTFYETPEQWFNIADNLKAEDVKAMQKQKVEVTIEKGDGKSYDNVTSIKVVEGSKPESKNEFDKKSSTSSSVQKSIEAQVSVEHAVTLVAKLGVSVEEASNAVRKFAENNYQIIQDLKKK